jgi:hypothetical protein
MAIGDCKKLLTLRIMSKDQLICFSPGKKYYLIALHPKHSSDAQRSRERHGFVGRPIARGSVWSQDWWQQAMDKASKILKWSGRFLVQHNPPSGGYRAMSALKGQT